MDHPRYEPLPAPSALELSAQPFPDAPPGFLVSAFLWLRFALARLARALGPAELCVFEDATHTMLLQVLVALVRARVPEALVAGPRGAEELAAQLGLNSDALFRTLRCCAVKGYFRMLADGRFEHNARSRVLLGGGLNRAREFLLYFGSGSNLAAWARFEHALRTGRSPFDHVHGMNVWEWFERNGDEREMFAQAMMGASAMDAPLIARLYPFRELTRVCDVGGGRGTVLSELLLRHPHLSGILCDSPGVLESARSLLEARGVLARVSLEPGSFFDRVPSGADAYLLKNILHDWNDATCVRILSNIRAAAGRTSRLLIAEALVERLSRDVIGVPADLQMMVACSEGRERGLREFELLLTQSGWRLGRVFGYPTVSLVEALAA